MQIQMFQLLIKVHVFTTVQQLLQINSIERAKLKQFLCLVYYFKKAALHLLWIANDIEKNPGPVGETFSEQLRKVLQPLCASLLKLYQGIKCKKVPNNFWTRNADFFLHNPETGKVYSCTYKCLPTEALIDILIVCCNSSDNLSNEVRNEVEAWQSCDFEELFKLHQISNSVNEKVQEITSKIARISKFSESAKESLQLLGIEINDVNFRKWLSFNPIDENRKLSQLCWEAFRHISCVLCKIANNGCKVKMYKSPEDWPQEFEEFKDPHNEKKGQHLKNFFNDLLKYCNKKYPESKILLDHWSYIDACTKWIICPQIQHCLLEEYVLHHDAEIVEENLKILQSEDLLCAAMQMLSERGIQLKTDKWMTKIPQTAHVADSRKRKQKCSTTTGGPQTKNIKTTSPKISPKERLLRTKSEIQIKFELNGKPIKITTHGYKPDFSTFKEVQYQDKKTKEEIKKSEEILNENCLINAKTSDIFLCNIPPLEDFAEISTIKSVNSTDDKSIQKSLPGNSINQCVQISRPMAMCPIESGLCMGINTSCIYQPSEFPPISHDSSLKMTTGSIISPDVHIHKAVTEENLSNTASKDNNLNNEYHDDNMFDNMLLNNDDFQYLLSIVSNRDIINSDLTNDLMEESILFTSGSMNFKSCNADDHFISDQSTDISDIDFLYVENTK